MAEQWTTKQQDEITALYRQLKGGYEREAYKKLFGGTQLPYEQTRGILEEFIGKQKKELTQQSLEGKTTAATRFFTGKMAHATGLIAVLTAVALASLGIPYTSLPLY